MTDQTFHLTPHDVRSQEFHKIMRGYDPTQVESFKQRVAEELDRLLRERTALDERLKNQIEQLRSFRERERAMNDALIAAQQLRSDIQAQADREAEVILREARAEAARIVERAEEGEGMIRQRGESAMRQLAAYVASFRALLDRHQNELAGLEAYLEHYNTLPMEEDRHRAAV
jgi:DivIVA domain-containing protein